MDPSGDQTMKAEDGDSVKGDTVQSSIPIQAKQTVNESSERLLGKSPTGA